MEVERGTGTEFVPTRLDTLVVDTDEDVVHLYWRGSLSMSSLDDFGAYPLFRVDVLDLDEESFQEAQLKTAKSQDNTLILEPGMDLFETPEMWKKKREADLSDAIPEGYDLEVSPLLLNPDDLKEGDLDEAMKKLQERKERRSKVQALKAQALEIAEKEKKKEEKAKKKAAKATNKKST